MTVWLLATGKLKRSQVGKKLNLKYIATMNMNISPNRTVVTSFASASTTMPSTTANNSYDEGHYILHVANSKHKASKPLLSCALSNQSVLTYDRETLKKVHSIDKCHSQAITDLGYTQINNSQQEIPMVVTSGLDGTVKIFDLRTNNSNTSLSANGVARAALELNLPEEALSVSIGYNGALAAVGGNKGNIHFFDLRSVSSQTGMSSGDVVTKPLGTYVDAHTEEVTRVRFQSVVGSHGYDTTSLLVSAGEDGLACIHDTSQPSEEAALKSVLNAQSPLRDVDFFGPSLEGIYCLTGSETMSVWHHDSAQPMCEYGDVRNLLSTNAGIEINYLVGCHWDGSALNLVAGNTKGDCAMYNVEASSITVKRVLSGGHKACIRAFASSLQEQSIITGGEDSRLCEWKLNNRTNTTTTAPSSGTVKTFHSLSTNSSMPKQGGGRIRRQKSKKGYAPY